MYTSIYAASSLLTIALASQLDKRQDAAAIASSLSSLSSLLVPPPSIASELTGVPSDVQAAATNPAEITSLEAEFATSIPSWFASLPTDAKSYIINAAAVEASVRPQISSLEAAAVSAGLTGAPTGLSSNGTVVNGTTGSTTTGSSSSGSSTGSSTKTSTKGESGTSTSSGNTSSSSGGAQSTGVVALGLAGVVGFAGLIAAL